MTKPAVCVRFLWNKSFVAPTVNSIRTTLTIAAKKFMVLSSTTNQLFGRYSNLMKSIARIQIQYTIFLNHENNVIYLIIKVSYVNISIIAILSK